MPPLKEIRSVSLLLLPSGFLRKLFLVKSGFDDFKLGDLGLDDPPVDFLLDLLAKFHGFLKRAFLAVLLDGEGRFAKNIRFGTPGHFVNRAGQGVPAIGLYPLQRTLNAKDSGGIALVRNDDDPVSSRFAELLLQVVAVLDGFLEGLLLAAIRRVAEKLRIHFPIETDPHIPSMRMLAFMVDSTDSFVSAGGSRHVWFLHSIV